MLLEKYPYLDSNMNNDQLILTLKKWRWKWKYVKYSQHGFNDKIQNFVFNDGQLKIFNILII